MRVIIIANGWLNQPIILEADDILIAANGGARYCLDARMYPEFVVGDLDSLEEPDLEILRKEGSKIIPFPSRKDFTDLELAIKHALTLSPEEIVILAALGARWDQTIANILLPAVTPYVKMRIIDDNQEIFFIHRNQMIEITGKPGDVVSLIPIMGDAEGITTHGLEYELQNEALLFGSTRGISNILLESNAQVFLNKGTLLCTILHNTTDRT